MSKVSYENVLTDPERWLTDWQLRWLRPRGRLARTAQMLFYFISLQGSVIRLRDQSPYWGAAAGRV
ncbi:MAG: hypothetical protein H6822_09465 [Planctomycetaceae bacterium]|nr:hypothetical protein [Planctomycetales bacterium]MCB9922400.1 hypothetical protein [Planctomycetaceae bacterium]